MQYCIRQNIQMRKLLWILRFEPTAKALMLMKFIQWMVWLQCKHSLSDLLRVELSLRMYIMMGGCYSNAEKLKAEHKVE